MGSLRELCWGSYALDPALMVYSLADCWTEYLAWLWCRNLMPPMGSALRSITVCALLTMPHLSLIRCLPRAWML